MGSERVSIPNAKSAFQSEWFFRLGGYKGGHLTPHHSRSVFPFEIAWIKLHL